MAGPEPGTRPEEKSPSLPSVSRVGEEYSVVNNVEERLITSTNRRDALLWTEIRGKVLEQDDNVKEKEHQRKLEWREMWVKPLFPVILLVTGGVLLVYGFPYPGIFILGACLYWFAPNYVKGMMLNRFFKNRGIGIED